MSRSLQAKGYESKVILKKGAQGNESLCEDPPDVLRATLEELESPQWWRSLKLDGIIMVAWARHRDTPIVRAIAASGTPLVLHVDGFGIAYPLFEHVDTFKFFWCQERGTQRGLAARTISFFKTALISCVKLLLRHTYLSYRHLRYATVVSLQTPTSLQRTHRLCTLFGGKEHGINLQLSGYPIPNDFRWDSSIPKEKRIIAIGRWGDLSQKRANVLMDVCEQIAPLHPELQIDIFGTKTEALAHWHSALGVDLQRRIHLHGIQPGKVVARAMQKAQVSFFPSSYEGGPQALFEGLSCGATTVGLDTPYMPGTRWAAACHHGDLAVRDTTEAYVTALDQALGKWERGDYSPEEISNFWLEKTNVQVLLDAMLRAVAQASPARKTKPKNGNRNEAARMTGGI